MTPTRHPLITLAATLILLTACSQPAQQVEVTRLVDQQVVVENTVEVTRVVEVAVEVPVETTIEVEVTRIVELVPESAVEEPAPAEAPTDTPAEQPTEVPQPDAPAAGDGSAYTVASGDTLSLIAANTGTAVDTLIAANNLTADGFIYAGQVLFIPGWDGGETAVTTPETAPTDAAEVPATAPTETPAEATAAGANLLPNPSFEGDWYFHLYNELQIPEGWQLATDEGPNDLQPGSGGLFNRPEVRVVPAPDLPPDEQSSFIFDGFKTVKAFKGSAPTSFSLFTDVALQPGNYRLTTSFFPDTVAHYDNSNKTYATDPLAAEVRIIHDNGGTGWQPTQIGRRNTLSYDFNVPQPATVRLGASFRNRFNMPNNGWFIDDWSLQALTP